MDYKVLLIEFVAGIVVYVTLLGHGPSDSLSKGTFILGLIVFCDYFKNGSQFNPLVSVGKYFSNDQNAVECVLHIAVQILAIICVYFLFI